MIIWGVWKIRKQAGQEIHGLSFEREFPPPWLEAAEITQRSRPPDTHPRENSCFGEEFGHNDTLASGLHGSIGYNKAGPTPWELFLLRSKHSKGKGVRTAQGSKGPDLSKLCDIGQFINSSKSQGVSSVMLEMRDLKYQFSHVLAQRHHDRSQMLSRAGIFLGRLAMAKTFKGVSNALTGLKF